MRPSPTWKHIRPSRLLFSPVSARAGNRQKELLSAMRAHTKAPCKADLPWETLRALIRPGRARTGVEGRVGEVLRRPHVLDAGPLGLAPCRVGLHLAGESPTHPPRRPPPR